jgi:alpha-aminoadipate carrier protein LysW
MATTTACPECGADIERADGTVQGEITQCPDCGIELEVTGLDPFKVEQAPEEEEDWGE